MTRDDRLQRAREAQARLRAEGKYQQQDPIAKARAKPASLRLAITAKCWDCIGGDADPCPRWRIGNCAVTACPLHPQRPYQRYLGDPVPASLRGALS